MAQLAQCSKWTPLSTYYNFQDTLPIYALGFVTVLLEAYRWKHIASSFSVITYVCNSAAFASILNARSSLGEIHHATLQFWSTVATFEIDFWTELIGYFLNVADLPARFRHLPYTSTTKDALAEWEEAMAFYSRHNSPLEV